MMIDPETRYRLLLDLSQKLGRSLNLQELLAHLLESIQTAVAYDAAGVFVLNRRVPLGQGGAANLIAGMTTIGFDPGPRDDDPMLRSGHGIVGHVIRTGERVVAPDVRQDRRYIAGRGSTLSEIAIPIVSGAEVIGALNLESDRLGTYTIDDAELLEFYAAAAAIAIEKALLLDQVIEKQRIEQQLRIARDVQTSLLPAAPATIAGYDIAGLNLPTWEIGGDYFDYIPLADERLGLVVADVSGKGVPAALIMATFRAALRTALGRPRDIAETIGEVDRVLRDSMDTSRFVTAVYGTLDATAGRFTYVNCGHNSPMLLRAGGAVDRLNVGRCALGFETDGRADSATVHIDPGDTLVLYTDGVVELTDARSLEFGDEALLRVLRASADRPARAIVSAVVDATRAHARREGYEDDFTLVVVKRDR